MADDLSLTDTGDNLVKSGTELIKDGNRLNVCQGPRKRPVPDRSGRARAGCGGAAAPVDAAACETVLQSDAGMVFNTKTCKCGVEVS